MQPRQYRELGQQCILTFSVDIVGDTKTYSSLEWGWHLARSYCIYLCYVWLLYKDNVNCFSKAINCLIKVIGYDIAKVVDVILTEQP